MRRRKKNSRRILHSDMYLLNIMSEESSEEMPAVLGMDNADNEVLMYLRQGNCMGLSQKRGGVITQN